MNHRSRNHNILIFIETERLRESERFSVATKNRENKEMAHSPSLSRTYSLFNPNLVAIKAFAFLNSIKKNRNSLSKKKMFEPSERKRKQTNEILSIFHMPSKRRSYIFVLKFSVVSCLL